MPVPMARWPAGGCGGISACVTADCQLKFTKCFFWPHTSRKNCSCCAPRCAGGLTAAALWWLAGVLRLPAWFGAAVLTAPAMVLTQRQLWDASFTVPLGTLSVAALAAFLRCGSGSALVTCVASAAVVPLIHPQALPLSVPILGWLLWKQRPALRAQWRPFAVVALIITVLHATWGWDLAFSLGGKIRESVQRGYPSAVPRGAALLAPLLGGKLLGDDRSEDLSGMHVLPAPLHATASAGLRLIFPIIWMGIAGALWREVARRRRGESTTVEDSISGIGLVGLVLQCALCGLLRIPPEPQYFFGTFAWHVFFAWRAMREWPWLQIPGAIYGLSAILLTGGVAWAMHRHGYASQRSLPTLGTQAGLARKLERFLPNHSCGRTSRIFSTTRRPSARCACCCLRHRCHRGREVRGC